MKRLIYLSAIFIIGALIGAALSGVLIGKQIDTLFMENRSLKDNLLVAEQQTKQLLETNRSVKKRVISNISTYVSFDEKNDYTDFEKSTIELTVEKSVREWLSVISGQDVNEVNYQLVPGIVDNREIEIEDKKIRLVVKMVVLSETVRVYLEVIPLKK